jgi:tRNA A37 N6-isopentenylltransferase MiaA
VAAKPAVPPPPVDPAAPPVVKKFDEQATEVTDMPNNYSLILEGGGVLVIKSLPAATDWKGKMAQRFEKSLWKISRALQSALQHYKKKPFTELMLILSPNDAQRLYWALPVGSALLIPAAQP